MKRIIYILIIFAIGHSIVAQSDLTFYHLNAATPQSGVYNPTYFPDANVYVSLPVLSGFNIRGNAGFSYNDLMRPVEGTDSVQIDIGNLLANMKPGSRMNLNGSISIFQFGIRSGNKAFTLSSNYRFDMTALYPVDFLDYFISGNGAYLGERVEETNIAISGVLYRETGIGYMQDFLVNEKRLTVGARIKYLQGMMHVGTNNDAGVTMQTDTDTYDMTVQFENAIFQTAGLNEISGGNAIGHLLAPSGNSGIAFDMGGTYQLNDKIDLALSINDIGSINWTTDVETHALTENEVSFVGFNGLDTLNVSKAISDSLDVWTNSEKSTAGFKSKIGPNIFASSSYRVSEQGSVTGSVGLLKAYFAKPQLLYGVGYTHQIQEILYATATVSRRGNERINLGVGLAARVSAFQFYSSINNLSGLMRSADEFRGTDFRIGLNLLFGSKYRTARNAEKARVQQALDEEYGELN